MTAYESIPSFANIQVIGATRLVLNTSSTINYYLLKPAPNTDRLCALDNNTTSFTIDMNLTDGVFHQIALYCQDYNNWGRTQRIDVVNPYTGQVLATQNLSSFANGKWVIFAARGHVQFVITKTSMDRAIVNGLFIDAYTGPPIGSTAATVADNPFVYVGGLGYWQEPDLGLSYVRARWLDSTTGSWLSVDPVESEPRYRYAYNSPTFRTDATGTDVLGFHSWQEAWDTAHHLGEAWEEQYGKAFRSAKNPQELYQTYLNIMLQPAITRVGDFLDSFEAPYRKLIADFEQLYGTLFRLTGIADNSDPIGANFKASKSFTAQNLLFLLPPSFLNKRNVSYWGGLYWGLGSSFASIARLGLDIIQLIVFVGNPEIWPHFGELFTGFFGNILNDFNSKVINPSFYVRGKLVGEMIGGIIQLVMLIREFPKLAAKLMKKLPQRAQTAIRNLGARMSEATGPAREALATVRQHVGTLAKQGVDKAFEGAKSGVRSLGRGIDSLGPQWAPAGGPAVPQAGPHALQSIEDALERFKSRISKMAASEGSSRGLIKIVRGIKVPESQLAQHDLAQIAYRTRLQYAVADSHNIAVIKLKDSRIFVAINQKGWLHSEYLLLEQINEGKFSVGDVVELFSERRPCRTPGSDCSELLGQYGFDNSMVRWAIEEGAGANTRIYKNYIDIMNKAGISGNLPSNTTVIQR